VLMIGAPPVPHVQCLYGPPVPVGTHGAHVLGGFPWLAETKCCGQFEPRPEADFEDEPNPGLQAAVQTTSNPLPSAKPTHRNRRR
jgi:hypothetical protein